MRLYGYQRLAWADELKREVYEAFGRSILRDLNLCDSFDSWMQFLDSKKYDPPSSPWGWVRPYLQFHGTDYRRRLCGETYWVDKLLPQLQPGVVVTDCRFPQEEEAIHHAGGVMWRIERPGLSSDGHPSEELIPTLPVDLVLTNDGTLADLESLVRDVMEEQAWTKEAA